MPQLPVSLPMDPSAGELPVTNVADVVAALPAEARGSATEAPVKEALAEAQLAIHLAWQDYAAYAAAQSDPLRSTGIYLEGQGEDRSVYKLPGEDEEVFRDRVFATPDVVTRQAIVAAATAALAAYTAVKPQCFESIADRYFVGDGTTSWHSFIGANPEYPKRLYEDRVQAKPGGAWAFGDMYGRYFVLRVPVLDDQSGAHAYATDGSNIPTPSGGHVAMFVADGSNDGPGIGTEASGAVATFVAVGNATAKDIYQGVINAVNAIRGHGVRWQLFGDPNLA